MIIDFFKTDKITPKGCHVFSRTSCHPFGIWSSVHNFRYNPAIPSGLNTT